MNKINWNLSDDELLDFLKYDADKPVFIGKSDSNYNRVLELVKDNNLQHKFAFAYTMLIIL